MTVFHRRAILHKTGRILSVSVRLLLMTTTALVVLGVLNVLVHTSLHVCPLHVARFEQRAIVPVVYGLPMGGEMFAKAMRGEIVLGGCVVGPLTGVCPHCHWPTAFARLQEGRAQTPLATRIEVSMMSPITFKVRNGS